MGKAEGTIEAYLRTVRQIMIWVAARPGNGGFFQPQQLTKMAVEIYLVSLEREGFSLHHRARVKSALSTFARWQVEEKGMLQKNPTRGIDLPAMQMLAPRQLSEDQRFVLRSLVEQEGDRRGAVLFALGRLRRLPGERRLLAGNGSYAYRSEGWLATRGS